jgi:hypothetical protein
MSPTGAILHVAAAAMAVAYLITAITTRARPYRARRAWIRTPDTRRRCHFCNAPADGGHALGESSVCARCMDTLERP